jgi:hypothetical protein
MSRRPSAHAEEAGRWPEHALVYQVDSRGDRAVAVVGLPNDHSRLHPVLKLIGTAVPRHLGLPNTLTGSCAGSRTAAGTKLEVGIRKWINELNMGPKPFI